MGAKVRRCLMIAVLLVPAAAVSAAASGTKVDPAAAASSCAQGRALNARLGVGDVAYLARFAPCVLRDDRRQLGLGYAQSYAASRLAATALAHLVQLPYLTTHQRKAVLRAEVLAASGVAVKMCARHGSHRAFFQFSVGDTAPPPVLTPLSVSRLIGELFTNPRAVARLPRTAWAVATGRGLVFQKGNANGASVLLVDFVCR